MKTRTPRLTFLNYSAKVLFVVQEHERNAFDQRAIEFELLDTCV